MTLLTLQRRFHHGLLSHEQEFQPDSDRKFERGMAIYRNAYRARLVGALRETYGRVWAWIGDEAFDRAAMHHAILHPPHSWTLDAVGEGFDGTLAELCPDAPEAAELAWLEWQMQRAFQARDEAALQPAGFGAQTANFAAAEWETMRLRLVSSAMLGQLSTDCAGIWASLAEERAFTGKIALRRRASVVVWRHELQPRFRIVAPAEARALTFAMRQAPFAEICAAAKVRRPGEAVGAMLGRWIVDGLIADVAVA